MQYAQVEINSRALVFSAYAYCVRIDHRIRS